MRAGIFILALVATACGRDEPLAGDHPPDLVVRSTPFSLAPGEERFVCYAQTLQEETVIDHFTYKARPAIHHLIFSRALAPEPEGMSECSVLYRASWQPLFGAATGSGELSLPKGAAVTLPAKTQVVVQLHLLNSTNKSVTDSFEIHMRRSNVEDPRSVGLFAFGKTELSLPPQKTTTVTHTCTLAKDLEAFAVIPHMHYLGRALRFEVAEPQGEFKEIFHREPWDFDDQRFETKQLFLPAQTRTRVSCDFDNPYPYPVEFGESSKDEMCFLITFALDREGLNGCDAIPASDAGLSDSAVACGEQAPNSLGIGLPCSKGGDECPQGLACTLDQGATPEGAKGFCFKVGCDSVSDCGGGDVTCCAPAQAGGLLRTCLPSACRPVDCTL